MIVITDSAAKTADADTPVGITVGIKGVMKDVLFKTRHICRLSLLKAICLGFPFFAMAIALDSAAESIREDGLTSGLVGKTRLTSTQITRLFSDVIDRGEVQDRRGTLGEPATIGLVVPLESHALAEHLRRDELEELLLHAPLVDALFPHETDA